MFKELLSLDVACWVSVVSKWLNCFHASLP